MSTGAFKGENRLLLDMKLQGHCEHLILGTELGSSEAQKILLTTKASPKLQLKLFLITQNFLDSVLSLSCMLLSRFLIALVVMEIHLHISSVCACTCSVCVHKCACTCGYIQLEAGGQCQVLIFKHNPSCL